MTCGYCDAAVAGNPHLLELVELPHLGAEDVRTITSPVSIRHPVAGLLPSILAAARKPVLQGARTPAFSDMAATCREAPRRSPCNRRSSTSGARSICTTSSALLSSRDGRMRCEQASLSGIGGRAAWVAGPLGSGLGHRVGLVRSGRGPPSLHNRDSPVPTEKNVASDRCDLMRAWLDLGSFGPAALCLTIHADQILRQVSGGSAILANKTPYVWG